MSELAARLASWREPSESLRQVLAKDELVLYCQPHPQAALAGKAAS